MRERNSGNRASFLGSLFTQHCSAHCSHRQCTHSEQHGGHRTRETQGTLYSRTEEQTGSIILTLTDCHNCIKSFYIPLLCDAQQEDNADNAEGHFSGSVSPLEEFSAFIEMKDTCVWCI